LFPLLIDPEEWTAIELGVTQRARLLNELLVDLYGEQRVLKEKVLPPGLVLATHSSCGRARGFCPRQSAFALRRVRSRALEDGRWWVLSDRTQAPSGAGYALENRVVSSQCLPDMFAGATYAGSRASFVRSASGS
jgi:uncharacterized circularly permuted ATP-grasp superfamily protein